MSYRTYKYLLFAVAFLVAAGTVALAIGAVVDALRPTRPAGPGLSAENVRVVSPRPGELVKSPLAVVGEARTWYFEGSFPVELKDADGKILATGLAVAQGDWMTDQFVPFVAQLEFTLPSSASGTLILKKDNPSGLPHRGYFFI